MRADRKSSKYSTCFPPLPSLKYLLLKWPRRLMQYSPSENDFVKMAYLPSLPDSAYSFQEKSFNILQLKIEFRRSRAAQKLRHIPEYSNDDSGNNFAEM